MNTHNPQNDWIERKVIEFDRLFPQFVEYQQSHTDRTTETIHAHLWLEKILTEQAIQQAREKEVMAKSMVELFNTKDYQAEMLMLKVIAMEHGVKFPPPQPKD